jgi:membrane-bound serine protease (ClpP class)
VVQAQLRRPATGMEGMVGKAGQATTALDPKGWVKVQGERWRARAEEPVGEGDAIEVVSGDGLLLRVKKGA